MFNLVIGLIRFAGFLTEKIAMSDGMKIQLSNELIEMEGRIQNTKIIVKEVDSMTEDEVNKQL